MIKRWELNKSVGVALVAGCAFVLAACSSDVVVQPPCPEILIPIDGSKLTRFKPGPGRDIIDVIHEEQVSGFAHGCEYNTDEAGAGEITVEIIPSFEAKKGPANPNNQSTFEFFVALTDQEKNVLEKKRLNAIIDFPSNMSRVLWQREEPITLTIPLKAGQTGEDFRIFIGLQMSRDELEYERSIR